MSPKMRMRFAKVAGFVVASADDDKRAMEAIREWFERNDGENGHTLLLLVMAQLFFLHLQRVHGEDWVGALMDSVRATTRGDES